MQIDQETKRTMSFPHLSSKEKEAIMKEKYMATMKPVSQSLLLVHDLKGVGGIGQGVWLSRSL